jgi:cellulose biosynthesis protein BcsQ
MSKTIAIYSMKGGVGKTTLATNLAWCAAKAGHRTLLWDLDAQGGAAFLLGEEKSGGAASKVFSRDADAITRIAPTRWPGLDLLAADLSLRHLDHVLAEADKPKRLRKLLRGLKTPYDCIVLDCPPGLGEISDQIFRAVDLIVMPLEPTPMALRSMQLVARHLGEEHGGKPPILPVFSMADRRKRLHRDWLEHHPGWTVIPHASLIERMAVEQAPTCEFAPRSPAAKAFAALWRTIDDAVPH